MFDNVGRDAEVQRGRRAGALLLSILLNGTVMVGLVWAGSRVVQEVVEEDAVEVMMEIAAPAPPPPPPPPGGSSKKKKEKKPDEEKPKEVVPEVVPLPEAIPEEEEESEEEGDPAGVEGGEKDGVADGVVGGVKDGQLGGQLGATGVKVVHYTQVQVKTRPTIRAEDYPKAAIDLHLPETRCIVRLTIDDKGVPSDATPKNCPELFHEAGINLAKRYRFYPLKEGGKAISVQFDVALVFKPYS